MSTREHKHNKHVNKALHMLTVSKAVYMLTHTLWLQGLSLGLVALGAGRNAAGLADLNLEKRLRYGMEVCFLSMHKDQAGLGSKRGVT